MTTTLTRLMLTIGLLFSPGVLPADIAGSADYPEIGRFDGSEIIRYTVADFDATTLATGPIKTNADLENSLTIEGRITRIVYKVPKGSSPLEVFRNFENRALQMDYNVIFSGGPNQIDDYKYKWKHPVEKLSSFAPSNKIWYLSAKKTTEGNEVYLSLAVTPHSGGDGVRVAVVAAEVAEMEDGMIDARKMQAGLLEIGRVALYGIYFDTDSSNIMESSRPTLDEIATLMRDNVDLRIIVVGHTDNAGDYQYNMDLSDRRAKAVADALRADYEIDASRLKSAGVGYLAPAASNASEDGRALNRRVELVQDK
jgi:outer membrane protein OmpA-like peptidoglycan-associated protein